MLGRFRPVAGWAPIMNLLVVGSTGPLGREFIAQAMDAGHVVRALARNPSALKPAPSLEVVRGDAFDQPSLDAAARGQDAAVVILGLPFSALRKPHQRFFSRHAKPDCSDEARRRSAGHRCKLVWRGGQPARRQVT